MSFTARVGETGQVFQAVTDMGTDGKENHNATLPIEEDHTYSGHLFDAYVKTNPTPKTLTYSGYEYATFEGRELEETSFDKLHLVPKRKKI
jgi:hypothetical protein